MTIETIAIVSLVCAGIPLVLFLANLAFYKRTENVSLTPDFSQVMADQIGKGNRLSGVVGNARKSTGLKPGANETKGCDAPAMSVLIPARNEEGNIRATIESVLANRDVDFEVVVLDDHSTDRTADIVREYASHDARVRLESSPPLPAEWCGKQHACHILAQHAKHPLLVFMDADVRLQPDALARMAHFIGVGCGDGNAQTSRPRSNREIALASGVPRQELGTFLERLLIPLIHFVLLGYLPMFMMRWTNRAAFSAGCGQLFIARADAYRACGGHAAIRATLHDGVKLPRLFRNAGFQTDLFDATDIATCRMYRTNAEVWSGLGKNATEGLAAPGAIVPMSALLVCGQMLPFVLLAFLPQFATAGAAIVIAACVLSCVPRFLAAWLFRQPVGSAILHPLGVTVLLVIQWQALMRLWLGRPCSWKGRSYNPTGVATPAGAP